MSRKFLLVLLFLLIACAPARNTLPKGEIFPSNAITAPPVFPTLTSTPTPLPPQPTFTATALPASPTPTPWVDLSPQSLGPNLDQFPPGYNPLTGLPVADPETLSLPALLISLSHFPPTVRPQTGLSFAAQVYEIYITEGMTRFLAVFYGDFPRTIPNLSSKGREEPFLAQGEIILGNRIWWDENGDGVQQPSEPGLGGLVLDLLDTQGNLLASTITDANGYYAFSVSSGEYSIQIHVPEGLQITTPNRAAENLDSDTDTTGKIGPVRVDATNLDQDAGFLIPNSSSPVNLNTTGILQNFESQATAGISGVRSAREAYVPIITAFSNSCLIAASKSKEVNVNICRNVYTSGNVNQAGISVDAMRALAQANRDPNRPVNYSGNLFTRQAPQGGKPARQINVFYSWLNQAQWKYDDTAQAYWRYHDYGDPKRVGQFTPALDRLTGRPALFENIVILFVEHVPRTSTIIDLNMGPGTEGKAIVIRNGLLYEDLRWTMVSEEYERQTGLTRPLRLRYKDGTPFPLSPGHTWFHIVTYASGIQPLGDGVWKLIFAAPPGTR